MRKRRLFCFVVACWFAISVFPFLASAAQKSNIIQNVQVDENYLTVLCANAAEAGEYIVTLDGTELAVETESVDLSRMPVTVFCLVDTSGSISNFKMRLIQDTLLEISASLGADDTMILATVDDQLTIGNALLSAEERESAIENIKSSYKDTDLHYGIVKSLEQLSSDETYHQCRCLVVLSDGMDCQDNGFTEQEVKTAIQNARVPIYTVALVENYSEREGAKILGSFARSSYGGIHLSTVGEGGNKAIRRNSSGTEFGRTIWESFIGTRVLKADLSGIVVDESKSSLRLAVQYKAGNNTYEDYVDLAASDFPVSKVETETQDDPKGDTEVERTTMQEDQQSDSSQKYLWIVATVLATAILMAFATIVLRRKKKTPNISEVIREIPAQKERVIVHAERETESPSERKHYQVYLTDIPHGVRKLYYRLPENQAVTFGRDSRSAAIINSEDKKLSGTHFTVIAQNEAYCVRDEKSRNGTFLNGVPIAGKGWCKLQSGDKLRAGSYEYRIIIEPEGDYTK